MINLFDRIVFLFITKPGNKRLILQDDKSYRKNWKVELKLLVRQNDENSDLSLANTEGPNIPEQYEFLIEFEFIRRFNGVDLALTFFCEKTVHIELSLYYKLSTYLSFFELFGLRVTIVSIVLNGIESNKEFYIEINSHNTPGNVCNIEILNCKIKNLKINRGNVFMNWRCDGDITLIDNDRVEYGFSDKSELDEEKINGLIVPGESSGTTLKFEGSIKEVLLIGGFRSLEFPKVKINTVQLWSSDVSLLRFHESTINVLMLSSCQIGNFTIENINGEAFYDRRKNIATKLFLKETKIRNLFLREQIIGKKEGLEFNLDGESINKETVIETTLVTWDFDGIVDVGKYQESKRKFLNLLKHHYNERQNTYQSQVVNSLEKKWYLSIYKSDVSLLMSAISNDFGLSLRLPFLWIITLLLFQTYLTLELSGECAFVFGKNWGIFFNILNPTHKSGLFVNLLNDCEIKNMPTNWIYLIDNLNRILIGYMIFQFAVAFRYRFRLR